MTEQEREELIEKMVAALINSRLMGFNSENTARAALAVAEPVIREQADKALREENARLRLLVKTAYAEGCYDSTKTEKTQEEFEALWRRTFSYKIISGRGKDEAP